MVSGLLNATQRQPPPATFRLCRRPRPRIPRGVQPCGGSFAVGCDPVGRWRARARRGWLGPRGGRLMAIGLVSGRSSGRGVRAGHTDAGRVRTGASEGCRPVGASGADSVGTDAVVAALSGPAPSGRVLFAWIVHLGGCGASPWRLRDAVRPRGPRGDGGGGAGPGGCGSGRVSAGWRGRAAAGGAGAKIGAGAKAGGAETRGAKGGPE